MAQAVYTAGTPRVLVVGDDITADAAGQLDTDLPDRFGLAVVASPNLTSADALTAVSAYMPPANTPDVLVVQLGRGDALAGVSPAQRAVNLRRLSAALEPGQLVLVTSPELVPSTVGIWERWPASGPIPAPWTDAYTINADWWDEMAFVDGALSIPAPDYFPAGSPLGPGARAAMFRDCGPWAAADIEVSSVWSGLRPVEATPLAHIELTDTGWGLGNWPVADIAPPKPNNPIWLWGEVGREPPDFVFDTFVHARTWSGDLAIPPRTVPGRQRLRSDGATITSWIDDPLSGVSIQMSPPQPIPAGLIGSTVHGQALDFNQTDGVVGAGGYRPPNLPGAYGPWWCVPIADADYPAQVAPWNATLREVPWCQLVDWSAQVNAERETLTTDGLTLTAAGIEAFSAEVVGAITAATPWS